MSLKLPKIIGHRGACGYAPENTIESIQTAADMGVEWVELDVKLSKDGVPMIFHDDTLDRTTNGHGAFKDRTFKELRELEAGSSFSEGFTGVKIPTLEEAVEVIIDRGMGLNLEIKPCPGSERETAEVALDELSRIWDDHDRLLISSFSHVSLEAAIEMANDWHRGLLIDEEFPENLQDFVDFFEPSSVNVNGNTIEREQVELIMEMELPILAYTINDPQVLRELQRWGIDGFFTDVPDVIIENLLTVH